MKKIINVTGMHCGHCSKAVEDALLKVEGVTKAKADHEKGIAIATMKTDVDDKLLIDAVNAQGFEAGEITKKESLFGW